MSKTTKMSKSQIEQWMKRSGIKLLLNRLTHTLIPKRLFTLNVGVFGESYTNGKDITISLPENFADKGYVGMFSSMKALLGHETEHIRSSDFTVFKQFQERVMQYFKDEYGMNISPNIGASLLNCTEDGRIENILVNRLKGYLPHIKYLNGVLWEESPASGNESIGEFLMCICHLATTGAHTKDWKKHYEGTEMDEYMQKIEPLIAESIIQKSAVDCADITFEILKVIAPLFKEKIEEGDNSSYNPEPNYSNSKPEVKESDEHRSDDAVSSHMVKPKKKSEKKDEKKDGKEKSKGQKSKKEKSKEKDEKEKGENGDGDSSEDENAEEGQEGKGKGQEGEEQEGEGSESESGDGEGEGEDESEGSGNGEGDDSEEGEGSGDGDESSESGDGDGEDASNSKSKKAGAGSNSEEDSDDDSDDNSDEDDDSDEEAGQGDVNADTEEELKSAQEIAQEIENAIREALQELEESMKDSVEEDLKNGEENAKKEAKMKGSFDLGNLTETAGFTGLTGRLNYDRASVREPNYSLKSLVKTEGSKLRRQMEELLKDKKTFNSMNRKNGMLDNQGLHKVGLDQYDVFMKKGKETKSSYAVSLLVDISGSMNGGVYTSTGYSGKTKASYAHESVSILEESLKGLVPLRVSYFCASGRDVYHSVVRDFSQRTKDSYVINRPISPTRANFDGFSIRVATAELLKRPEQKKLLIVLSDGLPSNGSHGERQLTEDVRQAVREARKAGVIVVAIGFGSEDELEDNKEAYEFMYQKGLILVEPSLVTTQLIRTLKRELK